MLGRNTEPSAIASHTSLCTPFQVPVGAPFPSAPTTPLAYLVDPDGAPVLLTTARAATAFCWNNPGWTCHDYGDGDFD